MSPTYNLNTHEPDSDGNYPSVSNRDNSTTSADGQVQVFFRGLSSALISEIQRADAVFGCVAWLTDFNILDSLKGKDVAIVVQKEDFLRPDLGAGSDWKMRLRAKYEALSCGLMRFAFSNMIGSLSTCGDPTIEPIRCVGNYNSEKTPAFPRMHNKFLVFAKVEDQSSMSVPVPFAVWTGSFNFTLNAQHSLENAVILRDPKLVEAYFNEFGQIMAISENLNWHSEWIEPEHRIGT